MWEGSSKGLTECFAVGPILPLPCCQSKPWLACGTLRYHFTKPLQQPDAPDRTCTQCPPSYFGRLTDGDYDDCLVAAHRRDSCRNFPHSHSNPVQSNPQQLRNGASLERRNLLRLSRLTFPVRGKICAHPVQSAKYTFSTPGQVVNVAITLEEV